MDWSIETENFENLSTKSKLHIWDRTIELKHKTFYNFFISGQSLVAKLLCWKIPLFESLTFNDDIKKTLSVDQNKI